MSLLISLLSLFAPPVASQGPERQADNHCFAHEPVVFHCVAGEKWISLCGSPPAPNLNWAYYRFGAPGSVELSFPADDASLDPFTYAQRYLIDGTEVESVSFQNGGYGYEIWSQAGPSGEGAGVTVTKGDETLATVSCTGPVTNDLQQIQVGKDTPSP